MSKNTRRVNLLFYPFMYGFVSAFVIAAGVYLTLVSGLHDTNFYIPATIAGTAGILTFVLIFMELHCQMKDAYSKHDAMENRQ